MATGTHSISGQFGVIVQQFLQQAITAERALETRLRGFASEGDDDEVRAMFAAHARQTDSQQARLALRLAELGGPPSDLDYDGWAEVLSSLARATRAKGILEERTLENIATAYSAEAGACAMYEVISVIARAAGDAKTEELARAVQAEESQAAEALWHFLPSRSKIAFNMLTIQEIDPAVETKVADDRLIGT